MAEDEKYILSGKQEKSPFIINPDPNISSETDLAVAGVNSLVERSLRELPDPFAQFESTHDEKYSMQEYFEYYMTRLSTISSELNAEEGKENNEFLNRCVDLTDIVASALRVAQVPYEVRNTSPHTFLLVNKIHVDPSLGQIVRGFNIIFVGTEDQLRQLIIDSYQKGNLINLAFYSSADVGVLSPNPTPEEILSKFWGI